MLVSGLFPLGSVPPHRTPVFLGKDHNEITNGTRFPGCLETLQNLGGSIPSARSMKKKDQRIGTFVVIVNGGKIEGINDFIPGLRPFVSQVLVVFAQMKIGLRLSRQSQPCQ